MTKFCTAVVLLLLSCYVATCTETTSQMKLDATAAKKWPVSKVTALLKDMIKQMEKEAEEDEEIYDKVACWCETNDKEKTKAIADSKEKISMLTIKIEELGALVGKLTAELAFIDKTVIKVTASLDTATSIRFKELDEFNQEEKDALVAIESLKAAITVLGKHHDLLQTAGTTSLLQVEAESQQQARSRLAAATGSLKKILSRHSDELQGVLDPKQKRTLAAFLDAPADYFDAEPTFEEQSYQPASGAIYGILQQMLETFQKNLKGLQDDEGAAVKAFESNKISLAVEIKDQTALYNKKSLQLADAEEKLSLAKVDLLDTKALLEADEKYLEMLKMRCQTIDQEWDMRQKMRTEEIEATSKALSILNSDEAHALFGKTFNPEFLQAQSRNKEMQARAAAVLSAASPRLAALAVRVRLNAFTKVKKAMNDMIEQLLAEKKEDIAKKDFCVAEFNKNEVETADKEAEKKDIMAKIEDLEATIKKLTDDLKQLKMEIEEMKVEMEKASKNRDDENADFQQTVADQQATQKLLSAALKVMEGFYKKSFVQRAEGGGDVTIIKEVSVVPAGQDPGATGPPPPPGFKPMKKNEKGGGVVGLLKGLIEEAKTLEEASWAC